MTDFNYVRSLFNDDWDVGFLTKDELKYVASIPIKQSYHGKGIYYTNSGEQGCCRFDYPYVDVIVLARRGHTWDYRFYSEAVRIMKKGNVDCFQLYTNYKEAAIEAGLGQRARNTMIHSHKFDFDFHIVAFGFKNGLTNLPTKTVNGSLSSMCDGCYDCIRSCPAQALKIRHGKTWMDAEACEDFTLYSNHPTIPSVKQFWHKYVHPEWPKHLVEASTQHRDLESIKGMKWDNNGYTRDLESCKLNGEYVEVYHCRECTSQPRCTKWKGKYPYHKHIKNEMSVDRVDGRIIIRK